MRGSRAYDPATAAFLAPRWSADEILEEPLSLLLSGGGGIYSFFPSNDPVNGFGKRWRRRGEFTSYEGNECAALLRILTIEP